jgi:hypothetical protein
MHFGLSGAMPWIATPGVLSGSATSMCRHATVVAAAVPTGYVSATTPPQGHRASGCHVVDRRVEDLECLGHVHMPICCDRLSCGVHQARVDGQVATETEEELDVRIVGHAAARRVSDRLDDLTVRLYRGGIVGVAGEGSASQVEHVVGIVSDRRRDAYPGWEVS